MKRLAVVVNSRANYGRIKSVLAAAMAHSDIELKVIVGASALLYRFGNVVEIIEQDGFHVDARVSTIIDGETPTTMAKSTGLAVMELATLFENMKPDVVVTVADRYETMATAIAASYMNIPLAHTQGGEVTGSIDESVRHAITKLAHIHFPATTRAAGYLKLMGEEEFRIHFTGCPAIDIVANVQSKISHQVLAKYGGVGAKIDVSKPYLVVLQHPVTTEYGCGAQQIEQTLEAVTATNMQVIWLWPNVDAGSDDISKKLRMFHEENPSAPVHFYRNFEVEDYARLISGCACQIGNSSSAIREGAFLGVPAVNIGSRQSGREHAENVIHTGYDSDEILSAIHRQIRHGHFERSTMFGDGNAGSKIVDIIAKTNDFGIQKRLSYSL